MKAFSRPVTASLFGLALGLSIGAVLHFVLLGQTRLETVQASILSTDAWLRVVARLRGTESFSVVKESVDVQVNEALSRLSELDDKVRLDPQIERSRNEHLAAIKKYWRESPPFTGDQWKDLRSSAEWNALMRRNYGLLNRADDTPPLSWAPDKG